VLSFGAASLVALSTAGAAFAEGSTLTTLVDDTKLNAGVQLSYEARTAELRCVAPHGAAAACTAR